ncbi:MAG: T9SS type A sorting domain-containing protein [Candidatus Krumholzibacteria bacterium]|nr:T9SS type A sorting domain-containing protein [Candidatus Krumholzibacteria bacterium]MDH4335837.1 T9SS type A sorting domain-containing protein [Candidatus Krumholzibacteria bacterium]MDH5269363.1 T9SS type A sorting domain-containing protein [Candidatus Krumholzibacteria bacterium]MDH5626771.1 T9SS type A sorting domain-containing protein [Candidatus Krumholzibacteria bacterium]
MLRVIPRFCIPSRVALLVVGLVACGAVSASAALRDGRLPLGDGSPSGVSIIGETLFDCGTYKGNQAEHAWRKALNDRVQNEVRTGKRPVQLALDYVYNDVWIVEDDGTLTYSGLNAFDTPTQTFDFTPTGGGYTITQQASQYDAVLGSTVATGDDGAVIVNLLFSFPYGGSNWNQMYVGGNGGVAFGGPLNPSGFFDNADFFSETAKLAPYHMDLNPAASGGVYVKSEVSKYTVTWSNVPEYGTTKVNTFQLVIYPSGAFRYTYGTITSTLQNGGTPIALGFHPGGSASLDPISFSAGLPHVTAPGSGAYEEYYNFATPAVNEVALFQRFYQQFPDDFFQLVFFTNFSQSMSGFANELNISNDVTGIGLGIFDTSNQYGSNSVLESRCNMNRLAAWPLDPFNRFFGKGNNFLTIMAQEAGHRWGAFTYFDSGGGGSNLILGRSDAHWSYYVDVDHSSLEGGNWQLVSGSTYTCPTTIDYFSQLDEYTFGLRTAEEVKDFYYISSPSNNTPTARSVGTPVMGANATGSYVPVTVEDIIAYEGARTPTVANEQHDLRQGFILLLQAGTAPTQTQLDQVANFRATWEDYFEVSCDGRLSCNTSITQSFDVAGLCGHVYDLLTDQVIPAFSARSLERGFLQEVPDGGRYFFRYMEDAGSGPSEMATIVFEADGYQPDTLEVNLTYGTETCNTNVQLMPIQTAVGDGPNLATTLHTNHPNPFNPSTTIRYELAAAGDVRLRVFDAAGRLVRTLVETSQGAGAHDVTFDGRDDAGRPMASGVYFYRLDAGTTTQTRKMVLLK